MDDTKNAADAVQDAPEDAASEQADPAHPMHTAAEPALPPRSPTQIPPPCPKQPTTSSQPPPAPSAPRKGLRRAHTQVDPLVGRAAPVPASHAPLQHAESDATGLNAAWLAGSRGTSAGPRGRPAPRAAAPKPPMQLSFPKQAAPARPKVHSVANDMHISQQYTSDRPQWLDTLGRRRPGCLRSSLQTTCSCASSWLSVRPRDPPLLA